MSLKAHRYLYFYCRMALDEKLYRRDLEVALALSVKELPPSTEDVQKSQGRSMLFSVELGN